MTYHEDDTLTLHLGDCLGVMRAMPAESVDAIVTDPPYGLGFMGKAWDALPPGREWADECLRVLKPGGHLLAFGGARTWHRLAVAVEDAGFELRDSIAWLYGSGFPKSLDVSKAIDKAAGATREVVGRYTPPNGKAWNLAADESTPGYSGGLGLRSESLNVTAPATDEARQWAGWGTALKPAFEPIVVGRKPLAGTVAANVLRHGVGALNIDACRIETTERIANHRGTNGAAGVTYGTRGEYVHDKGRWPANVALDDTQAAELGEPAKFFPTFKYQAKAPTRERPKVDGVAHPTVKPLDLMRWLVRLVTPPGGVVLEPFLGSGTTAEACQLEGFHCIGIERDPTYMPLVMARLGLETPDPILQEFPWLGAA